jgi:drug/metabolite transporter (DMT)-like permease
MSAGVGYALLSLVCAGVLDVVFGRYSSSRPVTGAYLVATGLCVMLGQGGVLVAARIPFAWDPRAIAWGLAAGAIALCANALLIESLARLQVSLGSTIYRLNTIAVVVFAVIFLDEALTPIKIAGVLFGVLGVVLLYHRGGRSGDDRLLLAGIGVAIAASLLRAVFGIVSKIGLSGGMDPFLLMFYIGAGWTLAALVYQAVRRTRRATMRSVLPYALLSGTLICLVVSFLVLGLRAGEASVVIPIANMSFIVALLVAAGLGMERITPRKVLAVASAALAITLLTRA